MTDSINEKQLETVWDAYKENEFVFKSGAGDIREAETFDKDRRNRLPEIQKLIENFLEGRAGLKEFKSQIDSENKVHELWGFGGYNGMMFFNLLYKFTKEEKLKELLQETIEAPENESEITSKIRNLEGEVESIRNNVDDLRKAPRLGSIPYFLSYFWHMQKPEEYPIYYTSMINSFSDLAIWEAPDDLARAYVEFWKLNHRIKEYLSEYTGNDLNLWDVEHAFWYWEQREEFDREKETEETPEVIPDSYVPPIVSILPDLAKNSDRLSDIKDSIESLFENRLVKYFQMLGFEVEELGQGKGRNPDGIIKDQRHRYAIIYDAKSRKDGYSINTSDERKFEEYIHQNVPRLRSNGFKNIYFAVISGEFNDEAESAIKKLKIETDIQEVNLIEADALLEILENYLRDPNLDLGPGGIQGVGIQDLFVESGIISSEKVKERLGA